MGPSSVAGALEHTAGLWAEEADTGCVDHAHRTGLTAEPRPGLSPPRRDTDRRSRRVRDLVLDSVACGVPPAATVVAGDDGALAAEADLTGGGTRGPDVAREGSHLSC
eukprot:CAMPEP_0196758676 /NCGR_PEP_ID=MMETSP1091-20130531/104312_1 /TAXON_ID=302021 /ORGANISM="Rhodomonas sp., Strain CCMP768" /LENGTH=107 /DNA_ID=CAMNT_0042107507 /DNA_START=416 /DNA_END=739 /DNA_ORIENTATION=+